jgi:predicted cobalt transporter CbtA
MTMREHVLKTVLKATLEAIGYVLIVLTVFELFGDPASEICLFGIVGYLIFWRVRFIRDFVFPKPQKEEETHLR